MEFEDGFTVPWHSHENEQITEVHGRHFVFGLMMMKTILLIYQRETQLLFLATAGTKP